MPILRAYRYDMDGWITCKLIYVSRIWQVIREVDGLWMDDITTHWISSYEEDFFASTQVPFFFFVLAQNDVVLVWTVACNAQQMLIQQTKTQPF